MSHGRVESGQASDRKWFLIIGSDAGCHQDWSMLSWTVRGTQGGWQWQGDVIDSRRVTGTGWCLTDNSSFSLLMNRQPLEMALCETLNQRNWEKQKAKLCGGYLALSIGSIITHSNVPPECCIYAMKSVGTGTNSNCLHIHIELDNVNNYHWNDIKAGTWTSFIQPL